MSETENAKVVCDVVSRMCLDQNFAGIAGGNVRYSNEAAFLDPTGKSIIRGLSNIFYNYSQGRGIGTTIGLLEGDIARAQKVLDHYINYTAIAGERVTILPQEKAVVYNLMLATAISSIPTSASPELALGIAANAYLTIAWNFLYQYGGLDEERRLLDSVCQKLMTYYWQ